MSKNFLIKNAVNNINEVYAKFVSVLISSVYPDEDQLYTEVSSVDSAEAERKIEDSRQFFAIGSTPLEPKIVELDTTEIDNLRDIAAGISTPNGDKWVTALKLLYAIDSGGNFKLYYKPVKLSRGALTVKIAGPGNSFYYNYALRENANQFFKYEDDAFSEITTVTQLNVVSDDIARYSHPTAGIKIKPNRWDTLPRPHNRLTDEEGDVTSVILPFQTFKRLADANPGRPNIILWNSVKETIYGEKNYIKHDIIMSSDDITVVGGDIKVPTASGRFANLSHLCPPSCGGDFALRIRL